MKHFFFLQNICFLLNYLKFLPKLSTNMRTYMAKRRINMKTKIARMPARVKICTAKYIITEYMGTKQICFQQLDKYKYDNTNSMVLTMISKIGRVPTWKQTEWVSQK